MNQHEQQRQQQEYKHLFIFGKRSKAIIENYVHQNVYCKDTLSLLYYKFKLYYVYEIRAINCENNTTRVGPAITVCLAHIGYESVIW